MQICPSSVAPPVAVCLKVQGRDPRLQLDDMLGVSLFDVQQWWTIWELSATRIISICYWMQKKIVVWSGLMALTVCRSCLAFDRDKIPKLQVRLSLTRCSREPRRLRLPAAPPADVSVESLLSGRLLSYTTALWSAALVCASVCI